MIPRNLAALFAATFLLAITTTASAAPLYTVNFLPTGFQGARLNDAGQVVGTAGGAAAIFSSGVVTSMAPSPSVGAGINNQGDIVGYLPPYSEALTNIGGVFTNIDAVVAGPGVASYATAINDHGMVGGTIHGDSSAGARGFLFHDGIVEHIGTFGGNYSSVTAINSHGAATGYATIAGGLDHAYIYQDGTLQDIGVLYGDGSNSDSYGNDINTLGEVVGWSGSSPFVYSGGIMKRLAHPSDYGGVANAINDSSVVVGYSFSRAVPGDGGYFAFVYANDALVDLNTLVDPFGGWQLTSAADINEAGQILGTACQNGSCASVLLTPVPEPATGLMLLAGLGALVPLSARRREKAI